MNCRFFRVSIKFESRRPPRCSLLYGVGGVCIATAYLSFAIVQAMFFVPISPHHPVTR